MKLNKNLKYVLLIATVGVTISTALWLKKQYAKLMKNTYKIKSFLVKKASLDAVTFDIVYAYENNTDIDINLVGQKYDIYVDDKFVTQIKTDIPVVLKSNAVSDIPLTITVNPKDLYAKFQGNLITALTSPQKLKIKMDSTFKIKLGIFTIPVPYPYEWTQGIPAILGKK